MNLVKLAEKYLDKQSLKDLSRGEKIEKLIEILGTMKKWDLLLKVLDQLEENSDRVYYGKQDFLSADEILTDEFLEDAFIPLGHTLKLSNHDDWLDIIYTDSPDNLGQLTDDDYLIYGLGKLTEKQREVLYLRVVKGFTNGEMSEVLGTSDRNIRKHYTKALEMLKAVLYETDLAKPYKEKDEIIALIGVMEWIR